MIVDPKTCYPPFRPDFIAVGAFIFSRSEVLMLLRNPNKPYGRMWGLPGGKMEFGETQQDALAREVEEETKLQFDSFTFEFGVNVRHDGHDFLYVVYSKRLLLRPRRVQMRFAEHTQHGWFNKKSVLALPMVPDQDACVNRIRFRVAR